MRAAPKSYEIQQEPGVLIKGNVEWQCVTFYEFGNLLNQKGTQNLFVILETNDRYENFIYTIFSWSYDFLLINENNC